MKNLKLISLLMLVITVMLFAFTSCEVIENITDKIPGIGGNDEHVHNFVEGKCDCGEEDPNYVAPHVHSYEAVVTEPTCTEVGYTTYTCECGDTYTEEVEKLGHVDANLDISCDRDGCTGKVAPAADSLLSNFTANNLGSKLSTSYYRVELR